MNKLFRTLFFVILTVVLFYGLDSVYTYIIKRDNFDKVWWMAKIENKNYDFALIGASRVYAMVQTDTLENRWHKKGIDIALDGSNIMEQYLILKKFYSNHNTVKDLFVELDVINMGYKMNSDFRVWCFLPFIKDDESVYLELGENFDQRRVFCWKYVPFYRYVDFNSKLGPITILNAFMKFQKPPYTKTGDWQGKMLRSINNENKNPDLPKKTAFMIVAKVQYDYLEKIMKLCDDNGTKVHLYTPPFYYNRFKVCRNFNEILHDYIYPICTKHHADYRSFCEMDIAHNPAYFEDYLHINYFGLPFLTDSLVHSYNLDKHIAINHYPDTLAAK